MKSDRRKELFQEFTDSQREVLISKGNDYATQDVLSNFKLAGNISNQKANNPSAINCLNLIATKVARLGNLLSAEGDVKNESVEDSVLDMANYTFLLFCILKENKEKMVSKPSCDEDERMEGDKWIFAFSDFTVRKLDADIRKFVDNFNAHPKVIEVNSVVKHHLANKFFEHCVFDQPNSEIYKFRSLLVKENNDLDNNEYALS